MRAMKDSGIEWIGEIPEEWKIKRFKNIGVCRNGLTYSPNDLTSKDNGILVLRSSNIQDGNLSFQDNVYVKSEVKETLKVHKGDILICSRNGSAKLIGKNTIIPEGLDAAFGAFMMIFRCGCPEYMRYILNSEIFNYNLASFLTSTVNQLTGSNFLNIKTCFVDSIEEREKIVSYLDLKSYKLESIISKEQEIIAKLQEYKLSLITEKVTKGLNPDVEMKDSGVEWIGEIPDYWKLTKLKYKSQEIGDGIHATPSYDNNGAVCFINGNSLGEDKIVIKDNVGRLNIEEFSKYKTPTLDENTILISLNGTIGKMSYYHGEKILLGKSAGYIKLNKDVNKHFIRYYLSSYAAKNIIGVTLSGSTIPNLSLSTLKNIYIPWPCLTEQKEIVQNLDAKCAAIDAAIAKKQALIEKFTEYKKSLIYEVVTGKKEV